MKQSSSPNPVLRGSGGGFNLWHQVDIVLQRVCGESADGGEVAAGGTLDHAADGEPAQTLQAVGVLDAAAALQELGQPRVGRVRLETHAALQVLGHGQLKRTMAESVNNGSSIRMGLNSKPLNFVCIVIKLKTCASSFTECQMKSIKL